jgi:hypothetical protein
VHSNTAIPLSTPQLPQNSIGDLPATDHLFVNTPEFYQRVIGVCPPIDPNIGFDIATGIELETLVTCSDGSFDAETNKGSHGWVIATTDKQILAQGAGPTDDQPSSVSSYRAELGGLIAVLYTIFRICERTLPSYVRQAQISL